ncbi:hypothetical protein [Caulobacter sp. NIBR2454]|uniref:hypothetical protein n=1 Tax=Caulobacter sp. NIBR2454 TaxID=3015996 RepID=UPI0022B6BA1A|nr:hypothetical protein [Caulobacter sp. NIBR2454]
MRRRSFIAGLALSAVAGAAQARSSPKSSGAKSSGGEEEDKGKNGPWVDLAAVALPIVVDGKLVNYVFVRLRVDLIEGSDYGVLKTKEPMLRDAVIRASYRTPFGKKGDVQEIDEARLKAAVRQAAIQVLGAKATGAVTIISSKPRRYLKAAATKTADAH